MNLEESRIHCQVPCLQLVAEGPGEVPPESLMRRLKLGIRRRLSPDRERAFKNRTDDLLNRFSTLIGRETKPAAPVARISRTERLQAGDWARVRSEDEIQATLNHWRQLKGCTFMPEQVQYCGTTHLVHKRMKQFVDERDLRVKKVSGIILLEEVRCQGTSDFGHCDRSCFYFWREEWLEKVDGPSG